MSVSTAKNTLSILCLALVLTLTPVAAQEAQYTQEQYDEYTRAAEAGIEGLLAYLKANPDSPLAPYALGGYEQALKAMIDAGQFKEAVVAGEKFLTDVDPERFGVIYVTAWSAYQSKQFAKAAKWGEKAVAKDAATAARLVPMLARAYQQTDNRAKFVKWAETACKSAEPKDCYDIHPDLMKYYASSKNWAKADAHAAKTIQALDAVTKPQGVSDAEWNNFVREEKAIAYTIRGKKCFNGQTWRCVQANFNRVLRNANGNRDRQAEAHYHLGMAFWNQRNIDKAMESFARCSLVPGAQFAKPCRTQLETLYKSTHNDSLQGLEDYLATVSTR